MKAAVKKPPGRAQVRIERVGADGDGVGCLPDGAPVYVPFTLPNEAVTVEPIRPRGEGWLGLAASIAPVSPARIAPPCDYFGRCGGCALQHWRDTDYAEWKTSVLIAALRRAGFADMPSVAVVGGAPNERRRLDFAVRRNHGRIVLGLHAAGSNTVIDLSHCLVLHPNLMALLTPLRTILQDLAAIRREASVVVNLLDSGPDVLLRTDAALSLADRTALIGFAQTHGVPRLSWALGNGGSEPVCTFRPPVVSLSDAEVRPPPGVFLQATLTAERAIVAAVVAGLPERLTPRSRIAEFYAGCGTLTFALARQARITAWEGDAGSVAALKEAINRAGLAGRIEAAQRDLGRQPLTAKELAGVAAVVLDPPHAGAAAQVAQIAAAGVPTVIYVSCNPSTLSRDARMLRESGYVLHAATAIDQFVWSARLESVSVFRRMASSPSRT